MDYLVTVEILLELQDTSGDKMPAGEVAYGPSERVGQM